MSKFTRQQVAGWNSHRERQRRSYVPASRPTPPVGRAFVMTPHNEAVRKFASAMKQADVYRNMLRFRFGYSDKQISLLVKGALGGTKRRPYHDFAEAAIRAKRRLDT